MEAMVWMPDNGMNSKMYCEGERKKDRLTSFKRPIWPIRPNQKLHLKCRERESTKSKSWNSFSIMNVSPLGRVLYVIHWRSYACLWSGQHHICNPCGIQLSGEHPATFYKDGKNMKKFVTI